MQLSLDKYLSDVERHLQTLPPSIRQGEIDEMASHLQQLRADFVASGYTIGEAEALATARFGTARRAGLRLRDVWEGNRGVWVTLAAVVLSNYVLQLGNLAACVLFSSAVVGRSFSEQLVEPLAPVIDFCICWTLLLLPFGLNFLLGRWVGRRVTLAVLVSHLPLMALHVDSTFFSIEFIGFKLSFLSFVLVLALASASGAWGGSTLKRRGRFALVGGASLEEASARLRQRQKSHVRRVLLRASTCVLVLGLTGATTFAIFKDRVNNVLHPATPEAAVRVLLAYPGMRPGEMHPSTNVSTQLLPETPADLSKVGRCVAYTATMHATEPFRQKRVAFAKQQLQLSLARHDSHAAKAHLDFLARLNPDGYTISGVARVRETAQGWEADDRDLPENPLREWLYSVRVDYTTTPSR